MNLKSIAKKVGLMLLGASALGGTQIIGEGVAEAAASCAGAGYLCFYDYATGQYGNVSGNNTNWGYLSGGWNDRADWFYNQGRTHNVCIYQHANYVMSSGGWRSWIPRNVSVGGPQNEVSSNYWTTGSLTSCAWN